MFCYLHISDPSKHQRPKQFLDFLFLVISGLTLCVFLTGCTFVRAVTFDSDEKRSGILSNQEAYLRVIFNEQITVDKWADPVSHLPPLPDKKLIEECTGHALLEGEGVAPIIPLVTLGAALAMDSITTAIEGYIVEKRRTMEKSYEGHINVENIKLSPVTNETTKSVRCIDLIRMVEIEGKKEVAMRAIFKFQTIGKVYYLQPIYLTVPYAAAVTEQDKGVKLAINIRMDVAIAANNSLKIATTMNENFVFKPVLLGKVYHFSPETNDQLQLKTYTSPIFVWPTTAPITSTIFVSVTETGSGVEIFDKATPQLQGASKQINEAIKAIIKEELGK